MATVNDVLRATLKGDIRNQDIYNLVFHYIVTAGTETNYDTIATAIEAALDVAFTGMEGQISLDVDMSELDLFEYDFVSSEFDGKASVSASALNGASAANMMPSGISVVMRFATEELRRQARKFIAGVTEPDVLQDTLQSLILTPALATAALLNDDIVAGGVTLRPCTFNTDPLSPKFETESRFTQTAFVNVLVGYQRNRQPGAGA